MFIFNIIFCLISVIIFILNFCLIDYDEEVSNSISLELLENFESGYFMEFHECSSYTNEIPIQFDSWQGTKRGCGTIKNDKKEANILEDGNSCKDDEELLEKIPPRKIYFYKGIKLCGKTKGKYYDLLLSDSVVGVNEECPKGTKNCGYIDSVKNKLCLDINSDCPISYIKIAEKPPEGISNLKVIKGDNINFYYSNEPYSNKSEIPYIQNKFKIADSKICSLPNLYYSNIDLFVLDAFDKISSTDCSIDTERYHALDEIDNYKLYDENGIINKIKLHNLTDYGYNINIYINHLLTLYVRTHFGFKKECLKKREKEFKIEEISMSHLNDNYNVIENYKTFIIIITCFSFGIYILDIFLDICLDKFIVEIILKCIEILISISLIITFHFFKTIPLIEEMDCSDFITNSNYNIMISKIKNDRNFIEITCYIFLGIGIIIFIFLIIIIKINCCKHKNSNLIQKTTDIKEPFINDEDENIDNKNKKSLNSINDTNCIMNDDKNENILKSSNSQKTKF